jgi:hypothetical protein
MLLASAFEAASPLSEVVFIHDYVQLRFEETGLSLYSRLTIDTGKGVLDRIDSNFADALVGLIGQRVSSVDYRPESQLRLRFSGGVTLIVSLRAEDSTGPELFQLNRPGLPIVIEQVA